MVSNPATVKKEDRIMLYDPPLNQPNAKLTRAVHKSEDFIFPSRDRVTRSVNSLLYGVIIFQRL